MSTQEEAKGDWSLLLTAAFVVGLGIRILLLVTTVGTNDAQQVTMWGYAAAKDGIARSYRLSPLINHPPLSLASMALASRMADALSLQTAQIFRAFQIVADLLTALLLMFIGRRFGRGAEAAVFFLLTPAAMFVSGFHCNSDPTMVMLIVASVACAISGYAASAGLILGLSVGIKIVPLLLFPLFALAAGRSARRFVAAFSATVVLEFVPTVVAGGPVVIRNIFAYSGYPDEWGIVAAALMVGREVPSFAHATIVAATAYAYYGKWLLAACVIGIVIVAWRPAGKLTNDQLVSGVPLLMLMLLFLAPGFGVQYLLWPLPLLPFAVPRRTYFAVGGVASAYLFYTYTVWSGGFPWWFADAREHVPGTIQYLLFALITWMVLGIAAAVALPRFLRARRVLETSATADPVLL